MDLSLDIRQAVRGLRRTRALTLATVLILGLSISAAASMYAVVDQVLLRPLPVRNQERVIVAWGEFQASSFGHVPLEYSKLTAIRERSRTLEQVAAVDYNGAWPVVGRVGSAAVPLRLGVVAGDLFGTLGVSPLLGRALNADDDRVGAAPAAVISQRLWQRRFGGDSAILGKPLPIWTQVYTIVGVLPGDFGLPAGAEAWVPLSVIRPGAVSEEEYGTLDLVGRLRAGASMADAKAELDRLLLGIHPEGWKDDYRLRAVVRSFSDVIVGQVRPALLTLLVSGLLVFLVAVLNLGGLLVVRTLEREQEFALRRALGASRLALVREVTVEAALVVALGSVIGAALSWVALRILPAIAPANVPRLDTLTLDPGVIGFAIGLGALGTLVAGLLPTLWLTESDLEWRGRGAGVSQPGRAVGRGLVVAAQVALAIVTVATALLLVRTLSRLQSLELGLEPGGLTLLQTAFMSPKLDSDEKVMAAMDAVLARVRAVPGVRRATAVLQPPLSGTGGYDFGFVAEGQTDTAANPYLNYEAVTPDYFETVLGPIVRGRGFIASDDSHSPLVVVVSRGLARRMWPGQDPIGKRIRWAADTTASGEWRTVVGVAADMRYRELLELRSSVYVPVQQQSWLPTFLLVRSDVPLDALAGAIRSEVRAVDPDLDVVNVAPVASLLARPLAQPRFTAGVVVAFGVIAVALAVIGLYGLISFTVARRTREVGIRLAIGAQPRQILTLILKGGLVPVAAGCAAGVALVLSGGQVLSSVVYGVTARDPVAIAGAVAGFVAVAVIAALVPARRAALTNPSDVLRLE